MEHFIIKLHAGFAYLSLILLIYALANTFLAKNANREFTAKDRKIALFALVFAHCQLLIGLVTYFVSPLGKAVFGQMTNADFRLTSLEHPLVNIVAIILITIGWSKHKKTNISAEKFQKIFVFYGLGLILILSRIPWKLWF